MKLRVGQRLPDSPGGNGVDDPVTGAQQRNRPIYTVTEVLSETPWHALYRGKKVFRNFEFARRTLEEVNDDECLNVFLKTIVYDQLDNRDYVRARREQAWFEAKKVLGCRQTNLLAEPLDYLEIQNDHDLFSFPRVGQLVGKEPVLVFENIVGQNLAKWRSTGAGNVAKIFFVLAQVLEFMRTVHGQDMLLNGLCPGSVWVDDVDRIYYLGSDAIVDASKQDWRILFPPERYARGFSPPEAFDKQAKLDPRMDIYGWAALAYYLLTGESPAQIAATQSQPFAVFGKDHQDHLCSTLRSVSSSDVATIASWFQVQSPRFIKNWPGSFAQVLFACLAPQIAIRPGAVETLCSWWTRTPPPAVPAALVVRATDGQISVVLNTAGLDQSLRLIVRRGVGFQPTGPDQGQSILDGPMCDRILDRQPLTQSAQRSGTPPIYTIFCVDRDGNTPIYSAAATAPYVDLANDVALIAIAEHCARDVTSGRLADLPLRLTPLCSLENVAEAAQALLRSKMLTVRRWGIAVLEAALRKGNAASAAEKVLWQVGLRDIDFDMRLYAAKAILRDACRPAAALVARLATELGGHALGDRIRAARAFQSHGIAADVIQTVIRQFEAEQPVPCPECHSSIPAKDLDNHLAAAHGYVPVNGRMFPMASALQQLWQQIFTTYDERAAAQIAQLFVDRQQSQATSAYRAAFESQAQHFPLPKDGTTGNAALRRDRLAGLTRCLNAHRLSQEVCQSLVSSDNPEVRVIARKVLLPRFASTIASAGATVADVRQAMNRLCPRETLDGKIAVCRLLADAGASPVAITRASADFELDRPVRCPHCGATLEARNLEKHKRLQHGVYELQGRPCTWEELSTALIASLFEADADPRALNRCQEIITERMGATAIPTWLGRHLAAAAGQLADTINRGTCLQSAATSVALLPCALEVTRFLINVPSVQSRDLGLACFAALKTTCRTLANEILGTFVEQALSYKFRSDAFVAVLLNYRTETALCKEAMRIFAKNAKDNIDRIELLQSFKARIGRSVLLDEVCSDLEETMKIRCPKCNVTLNGPAMRAHALQEHRLVLEGRRTRHAWTVATECLQDYLVDPEPRFLARGEELARVADGAKGFIRFIQMALQHHVPKVEYRRTLEQLSQSSHSTVCCSCYNLVERPSPLVPMSVVLKKSGDLRSELCSIKQEFSGLWTDLAFNIRDPKLRKMKIDAQISKRGGLIIAIAFAVTFLMLAASLAVGISGAAWPTYTLCGLALVVLILAAVYEPSIATPLAAAWEIVVPRVFANSPGREELSFIAGLAQATENRPGAGRRRKRIEEAITKCEAVFTNVHFSNGFLVVGMLYKLLISDQLHIGKSADKMIIRIAPLLDAIVNRRLPLECLDVALANGEVLADFDIELQTILRCRLVALSDHAGLHRADLLEMASISPSVRQLFNGLTDKSSYLGLMFATFGLPQGVLADCEAETPNDMANTRVLEDVPDLIAISVDEQIMIRSDGLYYQDTRFTRPPQVSVKTMTRFIQTGWTYQCKDGSADLRYRNNPPVGYNQVAGFELHIDGATKAFRTDPTTVADSIRQWSALYFTQLRPLSDKACGAAATGRFKTKGSETVKCNACGTSIIFKEGNIAEPSPAG